MSLSQILFQSFLLSLHVFPLSSTLFFSPQSVSPATSLTHLRCSTDRCSNVLDTIPKLRSSFPSTITTCSLSFLKPKSATITCMFSSGTPTPATYQLISAVSYTPLLQFPPVRSLPLLPIPQVGPRLRVVASLIEPLQVDSLLKLRRLLRLGSCFAASSLEPSVLQWSVIGRWRGLLWSVIGR